MRGFIAIVLAVAFIIGVVGFIQIRQLDRAAPPPGHPHHVPDRYAENLGLALITRNVTLGAITLILVAMAFFSLMQPLIADVTDDTPTSPPSPTARATQEIG